LAIASFMTIAFTRYSGSRRTGWASRFVVFFAALTFVLQSYVTQTHIHDGHQHSGIANIAETHSPGHGKTPFDSPADCPLCQAVTLAGAFVASATPVLCLPFVWVKAEALVFAVQTTSISTPHHWRSRAPPHRL
jgi:hypothetical protein